MRLLAFLAGVALGFAFVAIAFLAISTAVIGVAAMAARLVTGGLLSLRSTLRGRSSSLPPSPC